jgi:YesN/AraC family two-component response regulator
MTTFKTSLLIAEDDPDILSLLKDIFTKHFQIIYTAENGKEAQQIVRENKPDLILTDIGMPEQNGIEFVIKMRSEGNNTPIVIISASKDREVLKKAIKLGVQDYVEKPFKKAELVMVVHRVLEIAVRKNDLHDLILKFGEESPEVKQQKKLIGLLQAINAKG